MSIIKLSLKIVLPGRTLLSEQECSKNPKESFNSHSVVVEDKKVTSNINAIITSILLKNKKGTY